MTTIRVEFRTPENEPLGQSQLPAVPRVGEHVRIMQGRDFDQSILVVADVRWEIGDNEPWTFAVVTLVPPDQSPSKGGQP